MFLRLPANLLNNLTRIRANLENTLSICARAKETLERSMNKSPSGKQTGSQETRTGKPSMSYRDYVELSSIEEYQKFKNLPPIEADDLETADIDDLLRKFYES